MNARAIFFDFGGVLYRSPDVSRWLRLLGVRDTSVFDMLNASPLESQFINDLWTGRTPEQHAWDDLARRWRMRPSLLAMLRRRGLSPRHIDLDMMDFLRGMRGSLITAILTNAGTDFRATFGRAFGLETHVDRLIVSAEEGLCKPDPQIYQHAAALMGVHPSEVIFVDDREENITGAQEAGMTAFLHQNAAQTIALVKTALGS